MLVALVLPSPASAVPAGDGFEKAGRLGQQEAMQPDEMLLGGYACNGTLINTKAIKKGSTVLANVNLYWDGTNNCVETVSSSTTWGVSKHMAAQIWSCPLSSKGDTNCGSNLIDYDDDLGSFKYYAGPAEVYGKNRCVKFAGSLIWSGTSYGYTSNVGHCG